MVFEVRGSSNHPCPGRAVGKTDLVMVAVQGAPDDVEGFYVTENVIDTCQIQYVSVIFLDF